MSHMLFFLRATKRLLNYSTPVLGHRPADHDDLVRGHADEPAAVCKKSQTFAWVARRNANRLRSIRLCLYAS